MANITLGSMWTRVTDQINISQTKYTSVRFLEDVNVIVQDIWSEVSKKKL
jgi:hypothetical protein